MFQKGPSERESPDGVEALQLKLKRIDSTSRADRRRSICDGDDCSAKGVAPGEFRYDSRGLVGSHTGKLPEADTGDSDTEKTVAEANAAHPLSVAIRSTEETSRHFSLTALEKENPGLANQFLWGYNPMLTERGELWLHLGCGVRVFEGFVNLDIAPQDLRVIKWNISDLWPEELEGKIEGCFSEDCLEHFFYAEQVYILCNINRALKLGCTARILMPSLARLIESYSALDHAERDFLHPTYGVGTGADIFNYGVRFTGHRWLHDTHSLRHMAALCGFDATPTGCATSSVAKFNELNLRDSPILLHSQMICARRAVFPAS